MAAVLAQLAPNMSHSTDSHVRNRCTVARCTQAGSQLHDLDVTF